MILCCVDGDNDPATVSDGTVYGLDLKGNILFNEAGGCSHAVYVNEEVSGGLKGFVWNQSGTLKLRDSVENESFLLQEKRRSQTVHLKRVETVSTIWGQMKTMHRIFSVLQSRMEDGLHLFR